MGIARFIERLKRNPDLTELRRRIDRGDRRLLRQLAKRRIRVEKVGKEKAKTGTTPLQPGRWAEVLRTRIAYGEELGIPPKLTGIIFDAIHDDALEIEE